MARRSRGWADTCASNRVKVPAQVPAQVPAWIRRRASARPAARWIDWAARRRRAGCHACGQQAPQTARTAAILDFAAWKAALRR